MKTATNFDDYRHKLVDQPLASDSLDEINSLLSSAVKGLRQHGLNEHLIDRFIDKAINQLHGLSPLNPKVKIGLNSHFARTRLEIMRRQINAPYADHV